MNWAVQLWPCSLSRYSPAILQLLLLFFLLALQTRYYPQEKHWWPTTAAPSPYSLFFISDALAKWGQRRKILTFLKHWDFQPQCFIRWRIERVSWNFGSGCCCPFWPKHIWICQVYAMRDMHQCIVVILIFKNYLLVFFACFSFFLVSLPYANALDVWSCLRHSVLLVVLLQYWVPLQWMHTTVHSTKSPPKGWKEFKALKRQKGLSWDFFMYTEKKNKI